MLDRVWDSTETGHILNEYTKKESWYAGGKPEDIIRIDINDSFIVDYDKTRGMYRVSIFDDGHFWDEFWFDAYKEKEVKNE